MLGKWLAGLLQRASRVAEPKGSSHFEPAPSSAGSANAPLDLPPTLGFVARQPVLDLERRVVAYEFSVKQQQSLQQDGGRRRGFDRLLIDTLKNMNILRLLDFRRAFIHLSLASLNDEVLRVLPPASVIYLLAPAAGQTVDEALLRRLDALRAAGFRFAVEPVRYAAPQAEQGMAEQLFARMDYLVVDFAAQDVPELMPVLERLPRRYPAARWLARNVGTAEELELYLRALADKRLALFHGSYLAAQPGPAGAKTDSSQARVLEIMRLLRANAPAAEIEAQFKLDSLLLFKLLRFVNSPVNGLSHKIKSIEETLLLLGHGALFKWLSLLLYTARNDGSGSLSLLEKSLTRANFMEKLAINRSNKIEQEHLFLTGMFSFLGELLDVPLADALKPLDLPFTISDALLQQKGMFADHLQLAAACEQGDAGRIAQLAQHLALDLNTVNRYYMDAVVWAQEVLSENEAQHDVEAV
jgi:EAL and modified HD-GYP domain-containing signal transduction protein